MPAALLAVPMESVPGVLIFPEESMVAVADGVCTVLADAAVTSAEVVSPLIVPDTVAHAGFAAAPAVCRNCPLAPGARADHAVALR